MTTREGSLEAPTRHPIDWRNPDFYDEASARQGAGARLRHLPRLPALREPVQRVSRRCSTSIDESKTGEIDGVAKADFGKVVDQCYLCDICYMTKCPYVPPHPWNVDFPHLMLRAKAHKFRRGETSFRDRLLTSTDRARQAGDDSGRRADGQQGERDAGRAQGDGKGARRAPRAPAAALRDASASTRGTRRRSRGR